MVGFAAGGVTDVVARITAEELKQRLDRVVIVENRQALLASSRPPWLSALYPTVRRSS